MRSISFALTTDQVRAKTKTVTRRVGWLWLVEAVKRGEVIFLQPVVKTMGIPKGGHVEKIGGPIRVTGATREPLNTITQEDCAREGFPDLSPGQFVNFYCDHNGGSFLQRVTRIEFRYL